MYRLAGISVALFMLLGAAHSPAVAQDKTITVFAAASMKNALDDVNAAYRTRRQDPGVHMRALRDAVAWYKANPTGSGA